jgi:hypothetical protein
MKKLRIIFALMSVCGALHATKQSYFGRSQVILHRLPHKIEIVSAAQFADADNARTCETPEDLAALSVAASESAIKKNKSTLKLFVKNSGKTTELDEGENLVIEDESVVHIDMYYTGSDGTIAGQSKKMSSKEWAYIIHLTPLISIATERGRQIIKLDVLVEEQKKVSECIII